MASTVIAVFDNYSEAQAAKSDLTDMGFAEQDVRITANESSGAQLEHIHANEPDAGEGLTFGERVARFFRSLFGSDEHEEQVGRYSEAVRRGSCVLTVDLGEGGDQTDEVTEVLRRHDAIDIDEREEQWRSSGWTGYTPNAEPLSAEQMDEERQREVRSTVAGTATTKGTASSTVTDAQSVPTGSMAADTERRAPAMDDSEQVLPVVEEELKVGKREVQRGTVRVFTRTAEQPVAETVMLREQRVSVERRPVDRPATEADIGGIRDETIELTETAEEPVVSKTARVVEEVVIGKDVSERVETVNDVVRRTEVEVEGLDGDGDASGSARSETSGDSKARPERRQQTS
jgi:uncharacterized protein (TIGR02271 family)